ncbi:MAG: hypothetical protein ACK5N9_06095 [Pirellula sp.]|jgi:hypothetical protein
MIKSVAKTVYKPVAELHCELYGVRVCKQTVSRWRNYGRRIGGRLKTLRTVVIGGQTCTSPEWLREFLENQSEPQPAFERGPTAKQLERSQAAAEAFLTAEKI